MTNFENHTNKYKTTVRELTTYEFKNSRFKASKSITLKGKKWP